MCPLKRFRWRALLMLAVVQQLSGCSVISPVPLWELAKGAGSAVNAAVGVAPGDAVNVVYHPHAPVREVCIEYNPDCQVPDLIPALQAQLNIRGVSSRVYESSTNVGFCSHWIRYSAFVAWEASAPGKPYVNYVSKITLTMFSVGGQVLSSGAYASDQGYFGGGKWASVQSKLSPVVQVLINGPEKASTPTLSLKDNTP